MSTQGNGVHWTTKELVEKLHEKFDKFDTRLRKVEQRVAANRWVAPFVTAIIVAAATAAIVRA